jgi:hypothetical protein
LYATPQACCIYSITATAPHFNNWALNTATS